MPVEFLKNTLKSLLTDAQKRRIKSILDGIRYRIVKNARRSKLLTSMYFYVRGTFYEEQRAVLAGQVLNYEARTGETTQDPVYDLVRGVHRIEKGLSMRPRRSVFAENYIEELTELYASIYRSRGDALLEDEQFQWATNVLDEYFDVVENTKVINRAENSYRTTRSQIDVSDGTKKPFRHGDLPEPSVSFDELLNLAKRRHSTRWFDQRPVEHEKIDAALEVALESPSACNRQPFEFRIFDDKEKIQKICELPIGVSGYKENIPCLAVIIGKHRAYFNERDKHLIYIDSSLAAMGFQYGLEVQGVSTCCINWPAIPSRERTMRELLDLDTDEEVIMLMAIGYADSEGRVPYSEKRDVNDVRRFNTMSNQNE